MKLEHINVKEAVRYMGMGNNKPDERTALLIEMLHLLLCFFVSCAILVAMGEGSLCAYSHI